MLCLNLDTGYYIEAKHINDVLHMLGLDIFVEEYKELNRHISAHMLTRLPLNDQAITVDTGGEAPNGRLDADQKLTITIRYKSLGSPFDKSFSSQRRIGRHYVDCYFDSDRMRWAILIELNKFLPDNEIPGTAANGKDWFHYRVGYPKENKVQKQKSYGETHDRFAVSSKFRKQMEAADLSVKSTEAILNRLFSGNGLKSPEMQSSLICTKGLNVTNVYYSYDGSPVTLTEIESYRKFEDGEVLSCGTGVGSAFFVVDTSNVKTFKEKMIHRHVGVPKLTLNLSNGNSYELPFKKTYRGVSDEVVAFEIDCNAVINLSDKVLNNPIGPALMDLNEIQKDQYFIHGTEYAQDDFISRISSPDRS